MIGGRPPNSFPGSAKVGKPHAGISGIDTRARAQISLGGSYCGPISAHSLAVRGGISLRGLRALGTVNISGAVVSDDLDCGAARLLSRGGVALSAEHGNIGGSLLLDDCFRAFGSV